MSWDEYFLEDPKKSIQYFWCLSSALLVFSIFGAHFVEENWKWSFCLLPWNNLFIVKIHPKPSSGTSFLLLIAACDCDPKKFFWKPPAIMKIVPKASHDRYTGEQRQWERRKARTEILMQLSGKSSKLVCVSKEASRNLIFSFLFNKPT